MAPSSLPSKLLISFSSLLLAHACYSAHEHSTLATASPASSSSHTSASIQAVTKSSLPLDITLETLFSLALLLVGIVSAGWEMKPISLRKYAGILEGTPAGELDKTSGDATGRARGLYSFLDERAGFTDIRKQRKDFAEWVKEGELKSAMEER